MTFVRGFLAFWYDFIVGDSAVLAIGVLATVGVSAALVGLGAGVAAEIALPLGVLLTLLLSWPRVRR